MRSVAFSSFNKVYALELLAEHDQRHVGSVTTCKACVVARAFFDAGQLLAELQNAADVWGTAYLKFSRSSDGSLAYDVLTTEVLEDACPTHRE